MKLPPLSIGPLQLDAPVLCAPIAGFTDAIFRDIVRDFGGCGLIYTEMVGAAPWVQSPQLPGRLHGVDEEPRPLGVQLWDRDPAMLEEAARRLVGLGVSVIDLNFGCPKKRIMGKHAAGAALLRDPQTVGNLVAATVRGAGRTPVTAKIRLGPSLVQCTAAEVARSAEDNGAAAVTVHGRAATENYDTPSRWEQIAEVGQAVSIPVIANGDVKDAASALRALEQSGARGVMVARAALTRPWVFREIRAAIRGEPIPPPPTPEEQKQQLLRHHRAMTERWGDHWGTVLMRKFACRYLPGTHGARSFRDHINRAESAAQFEELVELYFPMHRIDTAVDPLEPMEESCSASA